MLANGLVEDGGTAQEETGEPKGEPPVGFFTNLSDDLTTVNSLHPADYGEG